MEGGWRSFKVHIQKYQYCAVDERFMFVWQNNKIKQTIRRADEKRNAKTI